MALRSTVGPGRGAHAPRDEGELQRGLVGNGVPLRRLVAVDRVLRQRVAQRLELRGRDGPLEGQSEERFDDFLKLRLDRLEPVVAKREWIAGAFSVADILMADVLRLVERFDGLAAHPATRDYLTRATARPAFVKAHADQLAHFAAADP